MIRKIFHGKLRYGLNRPARTMQSPDTNPSGSYTGIVTDRGYEVPEQDVDDL